MCGIFGFFGAPVLDRNFLSEMGRKISHRGPDGIGVSCDEVCGVGNVRLAIIDPDGGDQPFYSADRKVVLVQNGEIFNFRELRLELEAKGHCFKTSCDTEVLLGMYLEYGESFVSRLNGMFAIAIYDSRNEFLYLFRDRVGEKPLYYYSNANKFLFASEIKAFKGLVPLSLSLSSLNAMLRLNYVPAPHTICEHVYHVKPGSYLKIDDSGAVETIWWDLSDQSIQVFKTEQDWIDECMSLLDDAVRMRLVADVPFGAFLSGGVDSSAVVGLMAKHMSAPVRTYTIGFPDPRYDESIYAEQAARRFGTNHFCEVVHYDIVSDWSNFIMFCDQPHGDVSFIPMRKVSEIAARDVKMVLTGDGADELFAGYDKYVPYFDQHRGLKGKRDFLDSYMPHIELFTDEECRSLWKSKYWKAIDSCMVDRQFADALAKVEHFDDINKALYLDMVFLLSGNNLVKPDRMAMSHSLETRAPFLDYRMMEFAFRSPGEFKLHHSDKKYLLKKAVTPLIGNSLAYRKKQMFTMPIGEWFRQELQGYCRELLLSESSKILSIFEKSEVENLVEQHLSRAGNHTRQLRALISIELWLRDYL